MVPIAQWLPKIPFPPQAQYEEHPSGGQLVNSELLSDITFLVEDEKVYGHKLLCLPLSLF